jgi:hypothetical protein
MRRCCPPSRRPLMRLPARSSPSATAVASRRPLRTNTACHHHATALLIDGSRPTALHLLPAADPGRKPHRPSQRQDIVQLPLPPAAQASRAQSRPLHHLFLPINSRCYFSLHPAPPSHLPPSPSLLAPPPQLTTICSRPPPKSRPHRPSPTKVSGGVGRPRRPLHFSPSPGRRRGQGCRRAPMPATARSVSSPLPFSVLGSKGRRKENDPFCTRPPASFPFPTQIPLLYLSLSPFQINPTPLNHTTKQPCSFTNRPLGYSS